MSGIAAVGERVWQEYQDIDRVVTTKITPENTESYHTYLDTIHSLDRLGQAVRMKHNLDPKTHPISRKQILKLRSEDNKTLSLSTTKELLFTRIVGWQEGMESLQAGYDTWTEGRHAGYKLLPSLQELLPEDYFEMKASLGITPEQAHDLYKRIHTVVMAEIKRLADEGSHSDKMQRIGRAVTLLGQAVGHKYQLQDAHIGVLPQKLQAIAGTVDLYSAKTMLKAEFNDLSVRQALNLSDGFLSSFFGLHQTHFGWNISLKNVEKALAH